MEDKEIFTKWEEFKTLLRSTKRNGIEDVIKWLDETDFKFAPASSVYHNSFRGGLLAHSLNVYYAMYDFASVIKFFDLPQDTLIITALLHDVCKVECYTISSKNVKDENGNWKTVPYYGWDEKYPYGHGTKSVIKLQQHKLELSELEIAMIVNHMGGYTDDKDERRTSKLDDTCIQSLLLQWADQSATHIIENYKGPARYREKLIGRNMSESLVLLQQQDTVNVDGTTYKKAPVDAVVDNEKIIEVKFNNENIKVYAPHGDGLPF